MRALKILVVVMGILLIVGVAVVIGTIFYRAGHPSVAGGVDVARVPHSFGKATVTLPAGAKLVEMQAGGARIVLRLERADGGQLLLLLDADTGTTLGTIELQDAR